MSVDIDSPWWEAIVVFHAAATWFLVGLIWLIQVVHYPSFSAIDPDHYREFQQTHMRRMGQLIGGPWLIEGVTVLAVFALAPTGTIRALAVIGGLLEAAVIGVTIGSAIPAHASLSEGFNDSAHRRLLRANRIRTYAWTLRGVVALAVVFLTIGA